MRRVLTFVAAVALFSAGCGRGKLSNVEEISGKAAATAAPIAPPGPADWPWWRGPTLNGISADTTAPTSWSDSENVVWKADVPGRGHSTPSIRGDRIFLATADDDQQIQYLACYDRHTGERRWLTEIHKGGFERKEKVHEKNSQASATPACDGARIFITFLNNAAIWVSAVDLDGKIVWQTEAGPFKSIYGYAASPALHGSLVIVAGECKGKSFLAGLDRESGKIVWRVARPVAPTFSSPIVARVAGRDQILIAGGDMTAGYDPESGALLWQCEGPTAAVSGTMTVDGDLVYTSGGWPGAQTQCVRVEAAGNSLKGTIVWKNSKNFYVPSLVVHDGLLYAVTTEDGIVWCYDAATGEVLWQKRLGGAFKASPIVAAGRIYCVNEAGKAWVLKAGRKYEALAENDLGDGGYASPVICGGQLFLRTNHHLYCLGERGPGHHR